MMDQLRNPICLVRGWWWSAQTLFRANISGHDFEEIPSPPKTQILKCKTCGYESAGWFR